MNSLEELRKMAFELSCEEQYRLATFIAENVGYVLVAESEIDPPHDDAKPKYDTKINNSDSDQIEGLNSRIAELLRERDGVERVLRQWQKKLADLEDMEARGDLTKDWGTCSLINARGIVDDLTAALGAKP